MWHPAQEPASQGHPADDSGPADGRTARSLRSRRAIVDAMRALHAEGDLSPTGPRVAERAGVSLRTVWQQFADMEALLVEANRRDDEILRSLLGPAAGRAGQAVHRPASADPGADDP
jgi:AcrR family transcriptional regulator